VLERESLANVELLSSAEGGTTFGISDMAAMSQERAIYAHLLESKWFRFGLFFLFLAALLALRRPDALTNPQFLAESGSLIFRDQFLHGSLARIFEPYGGYFIVNTRLVGYLASLFPIFYIPLVYNVAAICIAAFACSLFSLPWYRALVASDRLRQAACILVACAVYTDLLVDELANTQWYLALIGLLILVRPASQDEQSSWYRISILTLLGSLAVLTGPVLIVAAPLAVWAILFRKGRAKVVPGAMLAGCFLEVLCVFTSASAAPVSIHAPVDGLLAALIVSANYKVWICSFIGERAALYLSSNDCVGFFLISIIFGAAWLVWLWFKLDSRKRLQMAIALYLGFGFILIALGPRGLWKNFLSVTDVGVGVERYFVLSRCILVLLFAMTVEQLLKRSSPELRAGLLLLAFSGGAVTNYRVLSYPDRGWRQSARDIVSWRDDKARGRAVAGISIPVHPDDWFIRLLPTFRAAAVMGPANHPILLLKAASPWDSRFSLDGWRNTPDESYLSLPPIFAPDERFSIMADICVASAVPATVSLYIHGRISPGTTSDDRMSKGTEASSRPQTVTQGCTWMGIDYVTDPLFFLGPLPEICIHVRHNSHVAVHVNEIVLERE